MANIATEIKNFLTAIYGKDVRASMVSLAEKLNHEVENNTTDAKNAADRANTSASDADVATTKANAATERASTAASNAERATSEAQVATQNANTSTENANTAARNANAAADRVDTAINAANAAADRVDTAINTANTAAENANQQALNAQNAADDARTVIEETQTAKQDAMTATAAANTAADNANNAADNANQAAANANSMPDRVATLEEETAQLKGDLTKLESFVTPEMHDAVGDGVADDTDSLLSAISTHEVIDLRENSYVISEILELHSIVRNGTIIYKGDVTTPVISLKDGGGLVDVNIVIDVENYDSSVVIADYTTYDAQWLPMRWTIDRLYIDNTITSEFIEGSSCVKITYDKWKVIGGQNISELTLKGYMDYGIHIEPQLRNTGSGDATIDDNPVFNSAVFSNIKFETCNTPLIVRPKMISGDIETALGKVGLMLLKFTNENDDKQTKPFMDLHNTTITGDMVIPWDYYGEYIPDSGTYRLHNSHINVNTAYFMRGNHNDDVRYGWFYDDGTGEYYTNRNVIKPENIGDRLPFRKGTTTPWSVDTIKAIRFKPDENPYEFMGFEMAYDSSTDPTGKRTVQFGFCYDGRMVWRSYDATNDKWSDLHSIYADGTLATCYEGKRPDGIGEGDFRFDETKGKPIWWNGSKWVFADGKDINTVYSNSENYTTLIPSNSDLDTYETVGNYGVRASDVAKTILNSPLGDKGFLLEVFDIGGLLALAP